jgi:hypothetical protein
MPTELPDSEYRSRLRELRGKLANTDADAPVWFSATSSHYVSGFEHVQTERPVVLALSQDRLEITVPRLEVERVETVDRIDAVHHYFDYPQGRPIETAAEMLEGMDADAVVADFQSIGLVVAQPRQVACPVRDPDPHPRRILVRGSQQGIETLLLTLQQTQQAGRGSGRSRQPQAGPQQQSSVPEGPVARQRQDAGEDGRSFGHDGHRIAKGRQ